MCDSKKSNFCQYFFLLPFFPFLFPWSLRIWKICMGLYSTLFFSRAMLYSSWYVFITVTQWRWDIFPWHHMWGNPYFFRILHLYEYAVFDGTNFWLILYICITRYYRQQIFFHSSGGWKYKIKVLADCITGDNSCMAYEQPPSCSVCTCSSGHLSFITSL